MKLKIVSGFSLMLIGIIGCATSSTSVATADDNPPQADVTDTRSIPGGYSGGIAYCEHGNRVYVIQGVNTSPAISVVHDNACSQPITVSP